MKKKIRSEEFGPEERFSFFLLVDGELKWNSFQDQKFSPIFLIEFLNNKRHRYTKDTLTKYIENLITHLMI